MSTGINAYKNAEIRTSNMQGILLKSYDYVLNNLTRLIQPDSINDPEYEVYKADAIRKLMELHESINYDYASETFDLPNTLSDLYSWCIMELSKDNDPMGVIAVISELREGFASIKT